MTFLSDRIRTAVVSDCKRYRMQLFRAHSEESTAKGIVGWALNNPSTADHLTDDNTVKKAWRLTCAWGYEAMIFVNTNPYRSTDPKGAIVPAEYVLEANDGWLAHAMRACKFVVCGWGDKAHPELAKRAALVMHALGPLHALRVTKAGNPQHPLYLPEDLKPEQWTPTRYLQ